MSLPGTSVERMDVAIAGAHGAVGRRLTRLLSAQGDRVRGLIRRDDQSQDVRTDGAEPVLCDLESATVEDVAQAIAGADAVVFAAGAGPGSGAARKLTMDRDGAIRLIRAAEQVGARRYVMVSSVGAESPPAGEEVFAVYLQAKAAADAALQESALAWTIVRPGRLTDDPGTGRVRIDTEPHRGEVPRDDVAAVLGAVLHADEAVGRTLYVNAGDTPVDEALAAAIG
ncbi:MAG: hypothetical protein JWN65_1279 [Solirubrobacterales bacterium]|nr:hypothetical protein [Solirubrobacterales bacterium]